MKTFLIFSLQLILITFSGMALAGGGTASPVGEVSENKPIKTIITCNCHIEGEKDGASDSWIENIETVDEKDPLNAINNVIKACNGFKKNGFSIKKARLVHCPKLLMQQN